MKLINKCTKILTSNIKTPPKHLLSTRSPIATKIWSEYATHIVTHDIDCTEWYNETNRTLRSTKSVSYYNVSWDTLYFTKNMYDIVMPYVVNDYTFVLLHDDHYDTDFFKHLSLHHTMYALKNRKLAYEDYYHLIFSTTHIEILKYITQDDVGFVEYYKQNKFRVTSSNAKSHALHDNDMCDILSTFFKMYGYPNMYWDTKDELIRNNVYLFVDLYSCNDIFRYSTTIEMFEHGRSKCDAQSHYFDKSWINDKLETLTRTYNGTSSSFKLIKHLIVEYNADPFCKHKYNGYNAYQYLLSSRCDDKLFQYVDSLHGDKQPHTPVAIYDSPFASCQFSY